MRLPDLNETELEIMKALWTMRKGSARELHDSVGARFSWTYSTTRTVLERMVKKGYLTKESFHGLYLYAPAISKAAGLARFVHHFASRVLETDLAPVVSLLAESETLTPEELDDLNRILDDAEEDAT